MFFFHHILIFFFLIFYSNCLIKGVTVPGLSKNVLNESNSDLYFLQKLGANWICLEIIFFQETIYDSNVRLDNSTPDEISILNFVKKAKEMNFKIFFKPIVVVPGNASIWINPTEPLKWYQSYEKLLLFYANLFGNNTIDAFSIGLELCKLSLRNDFELNFTRIIQNLRSIFGNKVKLTYSSLFFREYSRFPLWKLLDWIGIDAYFPIQNEDSWNNIFESLNIWRLNSTLTNIPIIFTEIGYPSISSCLEVPSLFPSPKQNCEGQFKPDFDCQAKAYSLLMNSVKKTEESSFGGFFILWLDNSSTGDFFNNGKFSHHYECFYTFRKKNAEQIINNAFISLN